MLIGLSGKAGVGKTTAADYLISKDFFKVGFKDALVAEITRNFPDLLREIEKVEPFDPSMRTKGPLLRALMQNYGTEVRRKDEASYWLDQWKARTELLLAEGKHVVCDDARFLNEVEAIRSLGGVIVRLTRPDVQNTGTHQSELEMYAIEPDFTIETQNGDLSALYTGLEGIIDFLQIDA